MQRLTGWVRAIVLIGLVLAGWPVAAQGGPGIFEDYSPAMLPAFEADMGADGHYRPFYDMAVTLTVEADVVRFTGDEDIRVPNTSEDVWDSVVLRLYPNLESYGGHMTVGQVWVENQPVTSQLDASQTVLEVPLPEPVAPGETAHLILNFETTMTPGTRALYAQFSYLEDVLAAPNFFPLLSVYEADEGGWWRETAHPQGDAVYSESAYFYVTLTAPDDLVIATSGVTLSEMRGDGATRQYDIVAPLMRDFALMASERFTVESGTVDGVKVNVYSYESGSRVTAGLNIATDSMMVFDAAFGQYPFAEVDVVETPTGAGGIEYPGLVVIAERRWDPSNRAFLNVIVHEIAHEWWYSLVGNDQTRDPWLDEALAQYSVAIFYQDMMGPASYQAVLDYYQGVVQPFTGTPDDLPIGLSVSAYPTSDDYSAIVYNKGPLFFAELADLAGQDTFRQMLKDYFAAYRYEVAEPADMLASFEATLGRDLNDIFRRWVGEFPGLE
jgi:aminopeptidase N